MNKVLLTGNLARDPEVRYTQSGKAVATFSLAVNRRFGKANDTQQPSADFISIVAWERLAEFCGNYLTKGSRILVEGRLQARSYDAQDGSKRYVTEVVASDIEFAGSRPQGGAAAGASTPSSAPSQSPTGQESFGPSIPDEEIPF